MNIIQLSHEEFAENVDFSFSLAEKGHTLKVTSKKGKVILITAVATEVTGAPEEVKIPNPEEFVPDPVATRQFVNESLGEMTGPDF